MIHLCLKQHTKVSSYNSGGQKSEMDLTRLRWGCQQGHTPSRGSREDCFFTFSSLQRLPAFFGRRPLPLFNASMWD